MVKKEVNIVRHFTIFICLLYESNLLLNKKIVSHLSNTDHVSNCDIKRLWRQASDSPEPGKIQQDE